MNPFYFNLKELCYETKRSLQESIINKNIVKLNVDLELPEVLKGNPKDLRLLIENVCNFLSPCLFNGAINIDITKKKLLNNQIILNINVFATDGNISVNLEKKEHSLKVYSRLNQHPSTFSYNLSLEKIHLDFTIPFELAELTTQDYMPFINKRILIVEDNEINAMVFSSFLEEWGCEIFLANHGEEALNMLISNTYDLILMDIHMPVLNGIKCTKQIREFNIPIPIIAITASDSDGLEGMFKAGADDYLLKPISSKQLFQKLSKYL
jgi:CheY-like chemotaxis protein